MLRSLLVALKPAPVQQSLIDWAVSQAERRKLSIDACAAIDLARLAPPESVPIGGSSFKAARDAARVAEAREQAVTALSHLERAAVARGIACRGSVADGDTASVLAAAAQRCDLVLCGHSTDSDSHERKLLQAILKHSPRPAVVVPEAAATGSGVLVAYDGSFQAARALAAFAESGLGVGQTVQVLLLDENLEKAREHADAAKQFLQRHELPASCEIMRPVGRVGDQLLAEAAQVQAGLLVMGALGKGAVRELLLGSVTRRILQQLPLPVLLDH